MEKNEDRRIRKSKEALKKSLIELMSKKPVNNIKVKELVNLADLNRSTFYNYYSDVPDMLIKVEEEVYNEFLHVIKTHIPEKGEVYDIKEGAHKFIEDICIVIKNNHELCKCLFSRNGDISFLLKIEELIEDYTKDELKGILAGKVDHLPYAYSFFKSGCIGILNRWIHSNCEEPASEIAKLTYNLGRGIIDICKI